MVQTLPKKVFVNPGNFYIFVLLNHLKIYNYDNNSNQNTIIRCSKKAIRKQRIPRAKATLESRTMVTRQPGRDIYCKRLESSK